LRFHAHAAQRRYGPRAAALPPEQISAKAEQVL